MIAKGREGNDFIWTGSGNDVIYGEAGNDTLKGWSGDDLIIGGDSNAPESDVLYGEAGNDKLYGWSGDDILDGGSENDTLVGGTGADTVTGGTGADKFTFQAQVGNTNLADFGVDVITDFQYGQEDKLVLWSGFGITLEDFDGIGDDKITSEFQVGQGETVYFDASPNDGVSPVPIALLSSITADYQFIPSLDIELI